MKPVRRGSVNLAAFLAVAILAVKLSAVAQTTTASVLGTVTDETGGVLPGAEVAISNVGTGATRTAFADVSGRFLLPELLPGSYEIAVRMTGFNTLLRKGITLAVGQQANLRLSMTVGVVTQEVTVTAEAPIIQTTESSVAGLVEEKRITDLPLNGRDFSQLALVEPGVTSAVNTRANDASKGFGGRISFSGSRPIETGWLLDGINIKSVGNFGTPGSVSGLLLGVDAVQEFQVLATNYTAEFGGNTGGVINMVTKSGTNSLHGTAYEFHRNDNLDARNFFDRAKPEIKRNQFGFSVGGPIRRNRTFFFGNYEALRERLGLTKLAIVPDANVHLGLVPNASGGRNQVQIASQIRPYLELWPLPNGAPAGSNSGLAELSSPGTERTNQHYFVTRVDHHLTDEQSMFSRFTFDRGDKESPYDLPIVQTALQTGSRSATVQLVSVWTPKLLSTTRVGYSRNRIVQDVLLNIDFPSSLGFRGAPIPPNIVLPGASEFGPKYTDAGANVQNNYQFQEKLTYVTGDHALKFGFDLQRFGLNPGGGTYESALFQWRSIQDFLEDRPLEAFSAYVLGSTQQRTFRQMAFGLYLHDDWKVSPALTLNLGVRYEPRTVPREKWGRISVVENWATADRFDTRVPLWKNESLRAFSPRVGFAWDPFRSGTTAIRGGFGLFYSPGLSNFYGGSSNANPPFAGVIRNRPTGGNFASAVSDFVRLSEGILTDRFTSETTLTIMEADPDPGYEMKFHLTAERQVGQDVSVAIRYLGGRGVHLLRNTEINGYQSTIVNGREFVPLSNPQDTVRPGTAPNPSFFRGQTKYTDAQSFYNALQLEVKKRFTNNFQFQTSYTWSKTVDDSTSGGGSTDFNGEGLSSTMYNTKGDRGLSALHVAHNLVVNGLWTLPAFENLHVASYILGGWQVGGIFTARTGTPFSVVESGQNVQDNGRTAGNSKLRRPDWVGRGSFASIINEGNPNLYFDPTAFALPSPQFYGNLGRNTFHGPGLIEFNMSLQKSMALRFREGSRLEFRAEAFNLFNRANFAIPSGRAVLNAGNRRPVGSAGRITETVTTGRQLQLGLKLIF